MSTQPIVSTYNLKASNGRHIRRATMVEWPDPRGYSRFVHFLELLPKAQAIRQAESILARLQDGG
jgi:hypothetical protein